MMCCFQYPSFEPTPHPSGLPSPDPTALPSLPPTGAPTLVPTTFDTTRLYVSVVLKAEAAAETTEAIVLPAFKGLLGGANASIPNVIQNFVATFQGGATKGGNVMCTFSVVESYSELGYNGPGEFEVRPFLKKCLDTKCNALILFFNVYLYSFVAGVVVGRHLVYPRTPSKLRSMERLRTAPWSVNFAQTATRTRKPWPPATWT